MTSDWFYNGVAITDESQFPKDTLGFVYKITRLNDGKFYYGKKLGFFKKTSVRTVTLKSGVKKKKKTSILVPSDWKTYWSSSVELQKDVHDLGEAAFSREIICFCENKGSLSFYEAELQFKNDSLTTNKELSYNGIINLRCHWKHIRPPLK